MNNRPRFPLEINVDKII